MRIEIEVRDVYGIPKNYPVNEAAKILADIAGTKTLSDRTLVLAEAMGMDVQEVQRPRFVRVAA